MAQQGNPRTPIKDQPAASQQAKETFKYEKLPMDEVKMKPLPLEDPPFVPPIQPK